ncbi:MAG TPA: ABC transporter substrate-binding protein [Gemmatimonadales bacterium]|nr:ABC transporter substrate-binding protein [Gemmatimonadales bacterium]
MARDRTRHTRRIFLQGSLAGAGLVVLSGCGVLPREIVPAAQIPRLGFLAGSTLSAIAARTDAFRQGLAELGYVEGSTVVIEWRSAEGNQDRHSVLAAELVQLKVGVIVAGGTMDIRAAREATATIPIVMIQGGDPITNGFVTSMARPEGNITGLATLRPVLNGKRLELLKAILPALTRVAVCVTSSSADYAQVVKGLDLAGGALGVQLHYLDVLSPQDVEPAFQAAVKERADAVLMNVSAAFLSAQRARVAEFAIQSRLPTIYDTAEDVEAGGLMNYGPNIPDLYRRAATYVDKILKGAKPADLPIEQPTTFDLVINLKTAQALGLTIPQSVLLQATEVIQ